MKKAWKIGVGAIAGMIGTSVLLHIHNAEVRKVYCERYGEGYDAGYTLGLYHGKLKGAETMYMNSSKRSEYFNDYMMEARKEFIEAIRKHNN